jgi:hypothetical protein
MKYKCEAFRIILNFIDAIAQPVKCDLINPPTDNPKGFSPKFLFDNLLSREVIVTPSPTTPYTTERKAEKNN